MPDDITSNIEAGKASVLRTSKMAAQVVIEEKLHTELEKIAPSRPTKKAKLSTGKSNIYDTGRWMTKFVSSNYVHHDIYSLVVIFVDGGWYLDDHCPHGPSRQKHSFWRYAYRQTTART